VAAGHASISLSLPAGDHAITAEYHGALMFAPSTSTSVGFSVEVPVLTLPPDQIVEATSADGAAVTFSASAHDDVDGTMPATCVPASGTTFRIGTTVVTCSVTEPHGNTLSGRFNVTVQDTIAPDITALSASPRVLWPPNHQMVAVVLSARTSDRGDAAPACSVASIASSEAANGAGDGNTAADLSITAAMAVELRAERAGNGPGRSYTIGVRCVDRSGNGSTRTTVVSVPHSWKQ